MNKQEKIYKCESCKYTTTRKSNMKMHISSKKHYKNKNQNTKYICKLCNYKTDNNAHYKQHLESIKHKNMEKDNNTKIEIKNNCNTDLESESEYYSDSDSELDSDTDLNTNFECKLDNKVVNEKNTKEILYELLKCNKQLLNVIQNGTHNITNNTINNTNTNTFNLNFFLNETCKDAINMKDFLESIEVSISDLKKLGNKGYVEGISSLMINKLKELGVTRRPIHSSDIKRQSIYIKDDDVWEKKDKNKMTDILWILAKLETRALADKYKKEYPKCETDRNSKEHEEYWRIYINALGGDGKDIDLMQKKVIKKIVENVAIDKTIDYITNK